MKYTVRGIYTAVEYGRVWARVKAESADEALQKAQAGLTESEEYKGDGSEGIVCTYEAVEAD